MEVDVSFNSKSKRPRPESPIYFRESDKESSKERQKRIQRDRDALASEWRNIATKRIDWDRYRGATQGLSEADMRAFGISTNEQNFAGRVWDKSTKAADDYYTAKLREDSAGMAEHEARQNRLHSQSNRDAAIAQARGLRNLFRKRPGVRG